MRIGIAGIGGRVGQLLAEEVVAAGHDLVGGIGRPGRPGPSHATMSALAADCDAVIDFTHASTVANHARCLAEAGTGWVLGTSGLSAADEGALARAAERTAIVYAANFAPGVNLVIALARRMAEVLPANAYDAEIIEMHHRQKVDAPSGTALALGRAVAEGRGVRLEEVIQTARHGHTGARPDGAIGFAALRGGQVVGEHSLIFAAAGEHIAISHRSFDRRAYAVGAVRAAEWLGAKKNGLYSMANVLGME
jgi:4-hydroxy-tetrahydrodipicolinate reductase